jgi:hypothetical protein
MEVYGQTGYVLVPHMNEVRLRQPGGEESRLTPPALAGTLGDPLAYLVAVVRGEIQPSGLSSLDTNLIVTEILDAARESANTGKRVELK